MHFVRWSLTAALDGERFARICRRNRAAETGAEAEQPTIVVTGQRDEYGVRRTSTATRTDTAIRNIPQALTVISESQIEDQELRSIADVLTFVPGAMPGTGEANRDQFTLRGNNTTADFFVDGIRDDVQYFRDLYNVDRVEVLRGANAMIFGRGGGGGVVNRVIKRSSLNSYRQLSASGDSQGGMPLDRRHRPAARARRSACASTACTRMATASAAHVDLERYGINPTLGMLAGPNTRIDVGYEYFRDRRTTDRGVPRRRLAPARGLRPHLLRRSRRQLRQGRRPHRHASASSISSATALTLRNRTLFGDYDKFYQNIYPVGPERGDAAGDARRLQQPQRPPEPVHPDRPDLGDAPRRHRPDLAGRLRDRPPEVAQPARRAASSRRAPTSSRSSDPTVDVDVTFANVGGSDANNRTKADVAAIYVQDQIRLSPQLEIVAGLRFDRFKLTVDDLRRRTPTSRRTDRLVSPRLGLIAKPLDNLSLYGSYSRSYLPQSGDQFSGLDASTDALKPERFDNYEVGAKWEPVEGLLATAAVYQLDRTNTQSPDPVSGGLPLLTGEQRSRGIELGLERSITDRWQVSAGYA